MTDDRISLRGLRARGHHGVLPAERRDGQEFVVDVDLHLDVRNAAAGDDLAATVDYAALAEQLAAVVRGPAVDLLETLAERLAAVCLGYPVVSRVTVTVHKPQAPIPVAVDDVAVTVVRRRPPPACAGRRAVLSLGANVGDRLRALQGAVDGLAGHPQVQVVGVSGVYETDPVGGPDQPDFLNAVVVVDTTLPPAELLRLAHDLEAAAGRRRDVRWGPRTLDVDLVDVGGTVLAEEGLALPHPRAAERAFVLVPWLEVDPTADLPGHGPVAALLARPGAAVGGVRPRPDLALRVLG